MAQRKGSTWEDAFTPVHRLGMFKVHWRHERLLDKSLLERLCPVAARRQDRLMAGGLSAYPFLDGGVVFCEQEDPSAWDSDVIGGGAWVVGNAALRAVCDTVGLPQPDVLRGEKTAPTVEQLRAAVTAGLLLLGDPTKQASAITYKSDIRKLVQQARGGAWLTDAT